MIRSDPLELGVYLRVTQRAGDLRWKLLKDQAAFNAEYHSRLYKK